MRSWFSLAACICFIAGLLLWVLVWEVASPRLERVASLAGLLVWSAALIAGTVSLVRRERWRTMGSFVLGLILGACLCAAGVIHALQHLKID